MRRVMLLALLALALPTAVLADSVKIGDSELRLDLSGSLTCGGANTCNAGVPYSLTALLNGTQTLSTTGMPSNWLIVNDTGHAYGGTGLPLTLFMSGLLDPSPENWKCGASGGAQSFFNTLTCQVNGVLGGTGVGGTTLTNPATLVPFVFTTTGSGAGVGTGSRFVLLYQSPQAMDRLFINGLGPTTPVPEPSALEGLLLGTGLLGLAEVARRKLEARDLSLFKSGVRLGAFRGSPGGGVAIRL
jgi:hypothetical protein